MDNVLIYVMVSAVILATIMAVYRDVKTTLAVKDRRKLIDEVTDFLHQERAVNGNDRLPHEAFMMRFINRFERDRWE